MEIGTVVTATDLNPLYLDFVPSFIAVWNSILPEADVQIVLIADEIPEYLIDCAPNIVLFPPLHDVNTAFQAQCVRLLQPRRIHRDNGVLITDMDMWPMNRRYYVENIEKIPENAFVTYRHDCFEAQQVAICYNVAHPSIWSSVLGSQEPELQLSQWYAAVDHGGEHGGRGWGSDQKILYWALRTWNGHKIVLDDLSTGFARLDRDRPTMFMDLDRLRRNILDGDFSDYHCLRPYSDYEEVNKLILDSLLIRQC